MQLNAMEHGKVIRLARDKVTAFRVIIAGRDSLTSGLLANALVHNLKYNAVATRHSDLLRILGISKVDLVIVSAEINSTARAGFDLVSAVSSAYPDIPIVILLDKPTNTLVIQAFRAGARGVFNPQDSMSEFTDCVEHVIKGSIWAGKEISNYLLEAFMSVPAPGLLSESDSSELTARELQVVQCAAMGKSNKAIAIELRLSRHTVKNYLFKAFEKLGVSSRVELLFYLTVRKNSFGPSEAEPQNHTAAD